MPITLTIKKQLIIVLLLISIISLSLLSFILRIAIEKCFHDYVWTSQSSSHKLILNYLSNYYSSVGTWNNFNGTKLGKIAKDNNNYFTLYNNSGKLIWTTENNMTPCCINPNHKYWKNIYPVMNNNVMVARITIAQYTDHIYSTEDIAFRRSIAYGIIVSLFITLILALPLLLFLSTRLSNPIRKLTTAANAMTKGNLNIQLDKQSSISELSTLAESIDLLRHSLIQQESLRKELTTNISHELRTPVNIIQNQLEAMIDGIFPTNKERLKSILQEMKRLTGLIGEIEKISKIENQNFPHILEDINLSELAKNIVLTFEASFKSKNIQLIADFGNNITIKAQKDKVTQGLLNLISNAYKFTDHGSVIIKCSINNDKRGIFEITDTGMGIDPNDIKNIFERFYRGEKSRNRDTGGAGLGLSILKSIADLYKWKILVQSNKNNGSKFTIIF